MNDTPDRIQQEVRGFCDQTGETGVRVGTLLENIEDWSDEDRAWLEALGEDHVISKV